MRPLSGHSQVTLRPLQPFSPTGIAMPFSTSLFAHGALYMQQATGNLEQDIAQLHTVAMSLTCLEVHDGQFSS